MKHRGMGSIFPRGGKPDKHGKLKEGAWWIKYYRNGKAYYESAGSTVKADAESLLKKRIAEIVTGQFVPPSARRIKVDDLVSDLLVWYRTVRNKSVFADAQESKWKIHLAYFFGGMRADQVGTDQFREYRKKRMSEEKPPSHATVNRELQVLRKAYKLAATASPPKVQRVPAFEMATEDNARKVFFSEAMKQKLREAAAKDRSKRAKMKGLHLRCFVEMLLTLGWRKGELTNLRVGNVHLPESFIRIEHTKSGEPREVPLTESLRVLLEPLVTGKNPDDPLFPVKDMRHAWKRLCEKAGIKAGRKDGFVIHDARRTSARTKRAAGVSESVTMDVMGWKTPAMFRRYGIVDRADRLEALRRSEQWEKDQRTVTKRLQLAKPAKTEAA
jgi:integrase